MVFDEMRARDFAQNNLMAGEDLLRVGNYAKVSRYGKVYLVLTTHRLMLVGKKSMLDFLLKDIMNVGWRKKKKLMIQTVNTSIHLKGKRKWRRTYDDFLRSVREQQMGFGVGARSPGQPMPPPPVVVNVPPIQTNTQTTVRERIFIKCPYCGNLVEQGNTTCGRCGATI